MPEPREIRISLKAAIGASVTAVAAIVTAGSGLFVWHAAQRQLMEDRLMLALNDAIYTLGQRDDRQDIRRAQLFDIAIKRIDDFGSRTERMETMVLERALEVLVKEQIEAEVPKAVEEVLQDAP